VPQLRIGCSGWNYKPWAGRFYPAGMKQAEWLPYYASLFDTVELNNSFYKLPESATFRAWRRQVPKGFLFSVKGSRFLTHMKRLREPEEPIARLFDRVKHLGPALGPVLYQLPARFGCNADRLREFLDLLPKRRRHAIEFRDPSWYVPEIFRLLNDHGVALVLHDKTGSEIREPRVGPFTYVRFHGPSGRYFGSYSAAALDRWARELAADRSAGRDVFAYFNNDIDAAAPANARSLRGRMG
jgi:uncharacterized protein YecE (DUF72 family)